MELLKHTMIHSLKNLGKLYVLKQRNIASILLFYIASVITIPLFLVTAIVYVIYYLLNAVYVYCSSLAKRVLVKTRSTLLAIPFIIIGVFLAFFSIVLYFITKGLSRLLQSFVQLLDIGKYLIQDELIFFLGKYSRPTSTNSF